MIRPRKDAGRRRAILAVLLPAMFFGFGLSPAGAQEQPRAEKNQKESPTPTVAHIIVGAPEDLGALWKKLVASDWVLIKGTEYRELLDRLRAAAGPIEQLRPWIVESVAVRGEVREEQAKLTVSLGATLNGDGPTWISARLDGLTVTRVREGDREWPVRHAEDGAWQVELRGQGKHSLEIDLIAPVVPGTEGHRLELPIPEAASTSFAIVVGPKVLDAVVGPKGRVAIEPIEEGRRTRLYAHLPPRSRLELTWRLEADPGRKLPPLLVAQGEVSLDIGRGFSDSSANWVIRSDRGTVRELKLRLDPAEELLELKLDDQPLPVEGKRVRGSEIVVVPLAEPLRAGGSRKLAFKTRRSLPAGVTPRWDFRGYPIQNAAEQRGVLAINQGDDLWIEGEPGRDLRRIDPRGDLPDHARDPSTVLAYQFLDQPFELRLRVDPSPPRARVSSRTSATIEGGRVRVDAWFDYQLTRGKAFEARIEAPEGLEIESVGPEDEVESSRALSADEPSPGGSKSLELGRRVLAARLKTRIRDRGTFRLHLIGLGALDPSGKIGLFRALDATTTGGKIVVFAGRGLVVDLNGDDPLRSSFMATAPRISTDTPSPDRTTGGPVAALWLRHETDPAYLPLRVNFEPRTIHHETTLAVLVEPSRIEGRQESICHVHHGILTHVDILVPLAIEGQWETEGLEVSTRARLDEEADGSIRYRLTLAREAVETTRLRFRYRLPLTPGLSEKKATAVKPPLIRIAEGQSGPTRFSISAGVEIDLDPTGQDWRKPTDESSASATDAGTFPRYEAARSGSATLAPTISATLARRAELPKLVASRVWLRTALAGDGGARSTAWYRIERHEGSLSLALPIGAILVRASTADNGTSLPIDRLPNPNTFRVRFPTSTRVGPIVVGIDYEIPARFAESAQTPPSLVDGGVSQWTAWEIRVPWNRAAVGTPLGWSDANDWSWGGYVFKRHPSRDLVALTTWIAGNDFERTGAALLESTKSEGGGNAYLFERPGDPTSLKLWVASRSSLVAIFSGTVLAIGMLVLIVRPSSLWIWGIILLLLGAIGAAYDVSAAVLAIQVGSIGFFLTLCAALTRRVVDRRRPTAPAAFVVGESTRSSQLAGAVGSDDSTVIRPRSTTIDHVRSPQAGSPLVITEKSE